MRKINKKRHEEKEISLKKDSKIENELKKNIEKDIILKKTGRKRNKFKKDRKKKT